MTPLRPMRLPAIAAALATCVGVATTLTLTLAFRLKLVFHAPALHVAVEAAASIVGLIAAYLLLGRFQRSRLREDLVLALAFALLSLSNLIFLAVPAVVAIGGSSPFWSWNALATRLYGYILVAAAAFAPRRHVSRHAIASILPAVAGLAAICATLALASDRLPLMLREPLRSENSQSPWVVGHPIAVGAEAAGFLLLAVAAIEFELRGRRRSDDFLSWLAVAFVFGAFSQLNYSLFPSIYSDWVHTGDGFRLLFYVFVLIAAFAEISTYWSKLADAVVLEERRRLARDLHDGLAQELALIERRAARVSGNGAQAELASAARRAREEARRTIRALAVGGDAPIDVVLADSARKHVEAADIELDLEINRATPVDEVRRDALLRISAEAVSNAVRHSQAGRVRVKLSPAGEHAVLRVEDDGVGFDPARAEACAGGFGLASMRQRVAELDGEFRVLSVPGQGTVIQVVL
jgi:signal transduction histidine kinase